MLKSVLPILHAISGKIFWFFSAHFPLSHPVRASVENALLTFYQWEIDLDPGLSDGYSKIASLLANRNQPEQAVDFYHKALEAGHPDPAKIHYFMGRQKARQNDIPGATECFKNFVRIAAESRNIESRLAMQWSRLEEDEDFDPRQFHGYLYLGNRCIENGLEPQAIEFLKMSITIEPLVIEAHYSLAETLRLTNHRLAAQKVVLSGHRIQLCQFNPELGILSRLWEKRIDQPDFLILGQKKCGTTALYNYLTQHPAILPALRKELHFFSDRFDRGLDWYLAQFPPIGNYPGLITGEASPDYIDSMLAAKRIRQHVPNARFIVLLRDPVERAISHYHMNVRLGLESGAIEQALLDQVDRVGGEPHVNAYLDGGIYVKMLRLWLAMFPREQFLILSSERLLAAPEEVTNKVFEFLGVAPVGNIEYRVVNEGNYAPADVSLKQTLRDYFLPHNQALEEFLVMQFGWNE